MSRRRYISSDISVDAQLAVLAQHGTLPLLLYTWAIPHMDDWGRMTGDPLQFKLLVCPALDYTPAEIEDALEQIADAGLWMRYEVDGSHYIAIPAEKWFKYQTYINKAKRTDDSGSSFPSPPSAEEHRGTPKSAEHRQVEAQKAVSPSPSPSPSPTKDICAPDDAQADEPEEAKPRSPFKSVVQEERFDEFWSHYPRKRSKGQAERAWIKLTPNAELFQVILDGLERAKSSDDWSRDSGQFIPYPATWLNAKGWEDEYKSGGGAMDDEWNAVYSRPG